jgi:hypothetical protein
MPQHIFRGKWRYHQPLKDEQWMQYPMAFGSWPVNGMMIMICKTARSERFKISGRVPCN